VSRHDCARVRIGPYQLSSNSFCLHSLDTPSPDAVTLRELGGLAWVTTDLVNARSLIERNPTALKLVAFISGRSADGDSAFGGVPDEMRDGRRHSAEQLGAQGIDINMGLPGPEGREDRRRIGDDDGAAKTAALVRGMIAAVRIPVRRRCAWVGTRRT